MAKKRNAVARVKAAGSALAGGLARLADIAPDQLMLFSEDSDWGLVGDDFREAMGTVAAEEGVELPKPSDDDEKLVEA